MLSRAFGKALNLIFPKLSLQNMHGFHHAIILSPSFHGVWKERLAQWPPISDPKTTKMPRGVLPEKLGGDVRHASWNPYPISDQNLWFSLPYFRPDQKFDILFQTWSPGAQCVTGACDKLLRHLHISWRKHYKGNRLIWKTYPIQTQMVKIDILFQTKTTKKNIPFGTAHTLYLYSLYIGNPPPPRAKNALQIMSLTAYASETN